jgi:hypothetical protein
MPPPVPEMKVPPELWPANVFEQWPIEQIKPHSPAQRMQALGGADRPMRFPAELNRGFPIVCE